MWPCRWPKTEKLGAVGPGKHQLLGTSNATVDDVASNCGFSIGFLIPVQQIADASVQRKPAEGMRGAAEVGSQRKAAAIDMHLLRLGVFVPRFPQLSQYVDATTINEFQIRMWIGHFDIQRHRSFSQRHLGLRNLCNPLLFVLRQFPASHPSSSIGEDTLQTISRSRLASEAYR